MAHELPFWTEGPIPPALLARYFTGRGDDVARLAGRWAQRAPARTVLVAGPRGGKRSLLAASLQRTEAVVTPIHVRLNRLLPDTSRGLALALTAAIAARAPSPSLVRIERQLRHGPADGAAIDALSALAAALDALPERPLLVLEGLDGVLSLPRPVLAALDGLVAGSRAHAAALVERLAPEDQEALPTLLGPAGVRVTRPAPLSRREAADYLQARFAAVRCQATPAALSLVLDAAGGDAAALQLIGARCHDALLRAGKGRLDESDAVDGLALALDSLPPEWTSILGRLTGRARDCFVSLAVHPGATVADIGRGADIDAKNVSVLLGRLEERGLPLEKTGRGRYRITQPLLAAWIKKEWSVVA